MADLLASGTPAWRGGRGGPVAQAALAALPLGVERLRAIIASTSPTAAAGAVDAADIMLSPARDRRLGLKVADRMAAVERLSVILQDLRVSDPVAVRALHVLLRAVAKRNPTT